MSSVAKPNIGTIHYNYDYAGALSEISAFGLTTQYEYDTFGRLARVESAEGDAWTTTYNVAGQKDTVVSQADGTTERYEYDALGRVERITYIDTETDEVLLDLDYELGPDGNRIAIVETRPSGIVVWRYKYDALGRLAIERRGETTDPEVAPATWPRDTRYTYDKDSNRLTKEDHALTTPVVETYHYEMEGGFRNQRVERISRGAEDIETFTWEDDGRLKTHTDADEGESTTYSWDGQRLTQARIESDADGIVTVDYAYDQNNDLIRRTVSRDGETLSDTRYLVDRQNPTGYSQVLAEIDAATGKLLRTNTWGSQLRAQSDANSPAALYPKTDALGSIRRLTGADASGNAVSEAIDYEAFGTPLATQDGGAAGSLTASAQSRLRYAFTAQLRDPATTLQHHRARWLATARGQWVSHDPYFDFFGNLGQTHAYATSNPIWRTDLSGRSSYAEVAVTLLILSMNVVSLVMDLFGLGRAIYNNDRAGMTIATFAIALDVFCLLSGRPPIQRGGGMVAASAGGVCIRIAGKWIIAADLIELTWLIPNAFLSVSNLIKSMYWVMMMSSNRPRASADRPIEGRGQHSDEAHNDETVRLAKHIEKHLKKKDPKARVRFNQEGVDGNGGKVGLKPDIGSASATEKGRQQIAIVETQSKKQSWSKVRNKKWDYDGWFEGNMHPNDWRYFPIEHPSRLNDDIANSNAVKDLCDYLDIPRLPKRK